MHKILECNSLMKIHVISIYNHVDYNYNIKNAIHTTCIIFKIETKQVYVHYIYLLW